MLMRRKDDVRAIAARPNRTCVISKEHQLIVFNFTNGIRNMGLKRLAFLQELTDSVGWMV